MLIDLKGLLKIQAVQVVLGDNRIRMSKHITNIIL